MNASEVVERPLDAIDRVSEQSESGVAVPAQKSSHHPCGVVMIDVQGLERASRSGQADGADTVLSFDQNLVLIHPDAVLAPEPVVFAPSLTTLVPLPAKSPLLFEGEVKELGSGNLVADTDDLDTSRASIVLPDLHDGVAGVAPEVPFSVLTESVLGGLATSAGPSRFQRCVPLDSHLPAYLAHAPAGEFSDFTEDVRLALPLSVGMTSEVADGLPLDPPSAGRGLGGNGCSSSASTVALSERDVAVITPTDASHRKDCTQ